MTAVLARMLVLAAGWIAAWATSALAATLLGVPEWPVLLASGGLWPCLLLLQ